MRKLLIAFLLLCVVPPQVVTAKDSLDESLIYYVYFGKATDVARILRMGANPNAQDKHHWPALAIASDRKSSESTPIAIALVKAGAKIDLGYQHNYPLINAIKNNNDDLVFFLITRGARLDLLDAKGRSAFELAQSSKNKRIRNLIGAIKQEAEQLNQFLTSKVHLRQRLTAFAFNNCAFQYWSFYVNSGQDPELDEFRMTARKNNHASEAQNAATHLFNHFPVFSQSMIHSLTSTIRRTIFNELDGMVSNRNRRKNGVGTVADMKKRCAPIVMDIREQFKVAE